MIRYKILAVAFSIFMVLDEGFSETKAEGTLPENNKKTTIYNAASPEVEQQSSEPDSDPLLVTATVYYPEPGQTDSTPLITADGSKINKNAPGKHRWIAVSRDLHTRWGGDISYGDSLVVSGISDDMDGIYVVRDTMNRRIRNTIDILVGSDDDVMGKWQNVQITRYSPSDNSEG